MDRRPALGQKPLRSTLACQPPQRPRRCRSCAESKRLAHPPSGRQMGAGGGFGPATSCRSPRRGSGAAARDCWRYNHGSVAGAASGTTRIVVRATPSKGWGGERRQMSAAKGTEAMAKRDGLSGNDTKKRSMNAAGWHQAAQTALHRPPREALPTHKMPAKARPRSGSRHPNKEHTPHRGPHLPAVRVPPQCRRPSPTPTRLPALVWRRRHRMWPHYFFLPLPLLPAAAAASLSFLASSFCFCLKATSS